MIKLDNKSIRIIFTDIDGVWTDGGMFYNEMGEAFKKFNTSDSAGLLFLKKLNIPVVVLTGEDSVAVKRRMEKLKIKFYFSGVIDKLKTAKTFCYERTIDLSTEAAFVGNDLNDYNLLKKVAHSAVPADAPSYIKKQADFVLSKKGGQGAFREYVEYLITQNRSLDKFIKEFVGH